VFTNILLQGLHSLHSTFISLQTIDFGVLFLENDFWQCKCESLGGNMRRTKQKARDMVESAAKN
jgi:hypothetical protein